MEPPKPLARGSTMEMAVRHALEHASAFGDHQTAAELSAVLHGMVRRHKELLFRARWDTVMASGRAH